MTIITAVGSRKIPSGALQQFQQLLRLCPLDWVAYTGEAEGCDETVFTTMNSVVFCTSEQAVERVSNSPFVQQSIHCPSLDNWDQAMEIGEQFHPAWHRLNPGARRKIARNSYQVLGHDLNSPTEMILCWTPDGALTKTTAETGGTGQAIRIANAYNIPVYNLNNHSFEYIKTIITTLEF